MAVRLAALLPRFVALTAIWVLATAALTFGAERRLASAPTTAEPARPAPTLVVPNVVGQAYVFAKGILEDGGFAWRVAGPVRGYAANSVSGQRPAPGTRVLDTGAPTIVLMLARGKYPERGLPENAADYAGTPIRPADLTAAPLAPVPVKPRTAPKALNRPKAKPGKAPAAPKPARKARTLPLERAAKRPPAFAVPGAPKEPLDEMPLPTRARLLATWLVAHPKLTDANARHWLYQHAWIVTGAKFGWWHGAEALRTLIGVDRRVEAEWGIGQRSETVARAALTRVEAKSR
jgi:PASTA domain